MAEDVLLVHHYTTDQEGAMRIVQVTPYVRVRAALPSGAPLFLKQGRVMTEAGVVIADTGTMQNIPLELWPHINVMTAAALLEVGWRKSTLDAYFAAHVVGGPHLTATEASGEVAPAAVQNLNAPGLESPVTPPPPEAEPEAQRAPRWKK